MIVETIVCEGFPILIPSFTEEDWELYDDFYFWINGEEYFVPEGFVTDFASVRGPGRMVVPRWGRYGVGAIIHDYCYRTQLFDRKTSDEIFKRVMKLYQTESWRIFVIYNSVKMFGWIPYNKYKDKK